MEYLILGCLKLKSVKLKLITGFSNPLLLAVTAFAIQSAALSIESMYMVHVYG